MSNPTAAPTRRLWLGGAAAIGAAATAAALVPSGPQQQPLAPHAQGPEAAPVPAPSGYQLTEHVKRYYATARV